LPDQLQPERDNEVANTVTVLPISTPPEQPIKEKTYPNFKIMAMAFLILLIVVTILLTLFQFYRFKHLESLLENYHTNHIRSLTSVDTQLKKFIRENSRQPKSDSEGVQGTLAQQETEIRENGVQGSPAQQETETQDNSLGLVQQETEAKSQEEDAPENLSFWNYSAKATDTLWSISETFYGSGSYYPVLLQYNPQVSIYDVGGGTQIKILNDTVIAKEIYQKNILRKNDHLYWLYTIMEGDTPQSLAMRFYKTEQMAARMFETDDKMRWHPGEKIRIKLK
jgi:LysM repeat protein